MGCFFGTFYTFWHKDNNSPKTNIPTELLAYNEKHN